MFVGPDSNIWFPIDGQAAVGQIAFSSSSGGGGGTGGGGGSTTVPSNILVSSLTIYIPAGQLSGSVTITGNSTSLAANTQVDITATSIEGSYSQVPQEVSATMTTVPGTAASISGTVEENATGNPGQSGVTVYIDLNGNQTFEPVAIPAQHILADPFTTTDANGNFTFGGLNAGTYTLLEVVPNGFTETSPAGGSTTVTVTTGQQLTGVEFANTPPSVSGSIGLTATDLSGNLLSSPTFSENNGQIRIVATFRPLQPTTS